MAVIRGTYATREERDKLHRLVLDALRNGSTLRQVASAYRLPLGTVNGWWQRRDRSQDR